jgi:hypothetical protein
MPLTLPALRLRIRKDARKFSPTGGNAMRWALAFILILSCVAPAAAAADGGGVLVNFGEGYGGKVYFKELTEIKGRRIKWRLLEFDLGEKEVREVATFRTFFLRSAGVAEMSRDGGGLYIVGGPLEGGGDWDYSLIVMAWNGVREVFETREAVPISATYDDHLTLLCRNWDNKLCLNFFKRYTKHIEEWRRKTGAGEDEVFLDDCYCVEYETYAGTVALDRKPVDIKIGREPSECIDGVSRRYSYFITEKNGESFIARKPSGKDGIEYLICIPQSCQGLEYVVLDGEKAALLFAILGDESRPKVIYSDFRGGEVPLSEGRVLYEDPPLVLTPVQSPYFPGVLVENVRKIGPGGRVVREVMALDATDGTLHKLFELYQNGQAYDYLGARVVQWVRADGGVAEKNLRVNNNLIYHRPSHKGRAGLVP